MGALKGARSSTDTLTFKVYIGSIQRMPVSELKGTADARHVRVSTGASAFGILLSNVTPVWFLLCNPQKPTTVLWAEDERLLRLSHRTSGREVKVARHVSNSTNTDTLSHPLLGRPVDGGKSTRPGWIQKTSLKRICTGTSRQAGTQ